MSNTDELLDIVDVQERLIGQRWRSPVDGEGSHFWVNPQGKLWLPHPMAKKHSFPLSLNMVRFV
jgi:hypothetical protein